MKLFYSIFVFLLFSNLSTAQEFTKVTDANNELAGQSTLPGYTGVSWIDYDKDGLLDCFINSNNLYHNEGDGQFVKIDFSPFNFGDGNGNTWGDIDNDGDLDVIIAASPTKYYRNDGDDIFTPISITEETIDTFNFWSATLGDYNQDGWLDLALLHPAGFLPFSGPISRSSLLFTNDGDGTFSRVTDTPLDDELAAFTVGSFTDFDLDGDLDLFVGSGEVAFLSNDHIYINQLVETDTAYLLKLTEGPLAEDLRDGQNWNWIDYDNDGDLDGFVTNYFGSKTNDLYRNENGTYVKMTVADVGNIVGQTGLGLCNVWADFDNDGFLDCYVTFDGQKDRFYHNNGDGSFTEVANALNVSGSTRGASAGDYDNDGYVDLFVSSASASSVGLYHNDGGELNWVNFEVNTDQGAAALGAKVRLKATINGSSMWQIREISSQNSFNGHNSYRAHFGLADAALIDSVEVQWPGGAIDVYTDLSANQFCGFSPGQTDCDVFTSTQNLNTDQTFQIYPNPANVQLTIEIPEVLRQASPILLMLIDAKGQEITQLLIDNNETYALDVKDIPAGVYTLQLSTEEMKLAQQVLIQR